MICTLRYFRNEEQIWDTLGAGHSRSVCLRRTVRPLVFSWGLAVSYSSRSGLSSIFQPKRFYDRRPKEAGNKELKPVCSCSNRPCSRLPAAPLLLETSLEKTGGLLCSRCDVSLTNILTFGGKSLTSHRNVCVTAVVSGIINTAAVASACLNCCIVGNANMNEGQAIEGRGL